MALSSEGTNTTMLVSPTNGASNGFGFGDGNGWWMILFFILILVGFGNGFGGGMNNGFVPYMNMGNEVQKGFDQAAIVNGINGVQASVNGLSSQLCNSFAQAEIANNARQMADMQQMFGLSTQFSNCCCENRLGIANLNSTILSENCADRAALSEGVRDIITNASQNTQRILDQLCNDKIDAKNEKIADLERQLTMANLTASQTAQTAQLIADNNRQTQLLNPTPIPAYIVQNPNGSGCVSCGSY